MDADENASGTKFVHATFNRGNIGNNLLYECFLRTREQSALLTIALIGGKEFRRTADLGFINFAAFFKERKNGVGFLTVFFKLRTIYFGFGENEVVIEESLETFKCEHKDAICFKVEFF